MIICITNVISNVRHVKIIVHLKNLIVFYVIMIYGIIQQIIIQILSAIIMKA